MKLKLSLHCAWWGFEFHSRRVSAFGSCSEAQRIEWKRKGKEREGKGRKGKEREGKGRKGKGVADHGAHQGKRWDEFLKVCRDEVRGDVGLGMGGV